MNLTIGFKGLNSRISEVEKLNWMKVSKRN